MSTVHMHVYARGDTVVYELQLDENPIAKIVVSSADAMRIGTISLSAAQMANTQSTTGGQADILLIDSLPSDYPRVVQSTSSPV